MMKAPEQHRVTKGLLATTKDNGPTGLFLIPNRTKTGAAPLRVIASDGAAALAMFGAQIAGIGEAWEHVSVSLPNRCPTWEEMCRVKALFWDDEDAVMQLHPPKSEWVNNHAYCLHLWRPIGREIPRPPSEYVGVQEAGVLHA